MGHYDPSEQLNSDFSQQEEQNLLELGKELSRIGKTVRPSMYFRITSKENILTYIENRGFALSHVFRHFFSRNFAPLAAFLFLIAFMVSSVIPMGVLNEVQASQIGSLTIDYGVVRVKRENKEIVVHSGERLYIGDEILVDDDAQASIKFIDNSSGVLSENSSIAITGVMINPMDVENSQVELALHEGNFQAETGKRKAKDGSLLRVHTPSGIVATTKGSFAVQVEETTGKTEVTAYSDSVMIAANSDVPEEQIVSKEEGGTIAITTAETSGSAVEGESSGSGAVVIAADVPVRSSQITIAAEDTAEVATSEDGVSVTELNGLRTKLYFAELKLKQAYTSFQQEDMNGAFDALYNYQERLKEIEVEYFGPAAPLAASGQYTPLGLLDVRLSSTLIIDLRELVVAENALSVYRDTLLYLRRMIALETTMRQEMPDYLEKQANKVQPHILMHRTAQELYPVMDTLVALEKERADSNDQGRSTNTTEKIEKYISMIANSVMKQQDSSARQVLLEDLLSVVPDEQLYSYMVLRFKIYFPQELHGVIDAKAAQMK